MSQTYPYIATCPKGLEQLLASELAALGAEVGRESVGSISFVARPCMRVLKPLIGVRI